MFIITRWYSTRAMFSSILSNYDTLSSYLKQRKLSRYLPISKEHLKDLVEFLEAFKAASLELEQDHIPIIHQVIKIVSALLTVLCIENEDDCEVIKYLKKGLTYAIVEKVAPHIQDVHYWSAILNPKTRSSYYILQCISNEHDKTNKKQLIIDAIGKRKAAYCKLGSFVDETKNKMKQYGHYDQRNQDIPNNTNKVLICFFAHNKSQT